MLACCACAAPRASRAFHTGHSTPHAQRQAQRTTLIITPFEAILNQSRKTDTYVPVSSRTLRTAGAELLHGNFLD